MPDFSFKCTKFNFGWSFVSNPVGSLQRSLDLKKGRDKGWKEKEREEGERGDERRG